MGLCAEIVEEDVEIVAGNVLCIHLVESVDDLLTRVSEIAGIGDEGFVEKNPLARRGRHASMCNVRGLL